MTSILIWSQVLTIYLFVPLLIGIMVGMLWSMKVLNNPGPPIKIIYETDIDSV